MFPVKTLYLLDEDFHDFCKHAQLTAANMLHSLTKTPYEWNTF